LRDRERRRKRCGKGETKLEVLHGVASLRANGVL
jgi:hypothetical protein